jgi:RNA polymerase sigma factor (sigma-70 family)
MREDLELVRAWQGGDIRAGGELFDRHVDPLYRFFLGKVGESADDLVQQTLTACLRSGGHYRGDASFRAYLFAIARRQLYAHLERRQREGTRLDVSRMSLHDLGTSPSGALVRKEDERLLLEALRRLSLEQQIVVELYFFERLRGRDLVAALGIPSGTVRSRLRLALDHLRQIITSMERSPQVLSNTFTTIDAWAQSIRAVRADGGEDN